MSGSVLVHCRRALLTDMYLRVKGAEGVFAIGDCSTIEHDLMIKVCSRMSQWPTAGPKCVCVHMCVTQLELVHVQYVLVGSSPSLAS